MFVLGIVIGLIVLFFLKELVFIGPIIAGLAAGIVAKGPIKGLAAGLLAVLIATFLFSISSFTADAFTGSFNITGFTIFNNTEPLSLAKKIFSISGVAIAALAGFVGGLIRR